MRFWISLVLGTGVLAAFGQPVLHEKQVIEATFPKTTLPGHKAERRTTYPNFPGKEFLEQEQGPLLRTSGAFAIMGGNSTKPSFEAVLVQEMSFGGFRVHAGEAEIILSPSGTVQTRGHIAVMDRQMRPAVFQITTDSLRLLEVRLPDAFNLQSEMGVGFLAVRPFTEYGTGRFIMELLPRPQLNILRIGGVLTIPSLENKARSGDFSAPFRIEFIPLY